MGTIKILAAGKSSQAQAQARGKLFEKLMADVLRQCGYSIDRIPSVNYAGMEIDIEGRGIATDVPLYAECKCYETEIDAPKFQAFYGKYMTRWWKDHRCQGLFVALPGINPHAKGFYQDNCEGKTDFTIRLLEEDRVLETIVGLPKVASPDTIAHATPGNTGSPGDWTLLYCDRGLFWVQYIVPLGGGIPRSVALFDSSGSILSDRSTVEYLTRLYPELTDFEVVIPPLRGASSELPLHPPDAEEIVEVRGSSA